MTLTKTPWTTYQDTHGEWWVKGSDGKDMYFGTTVCFLKNEKDAKLIAAAPQMLEALKQFVRSFENSAPCALDGDEYTNVINSFNPEVEEAKRIIALAE